MLSLLDLVASRESVARPDVPMSFIAFAEACGVEWETPGQRILCDVAFDGRNPRDYEGEEREVACELFGEVEAIPLSQRGVIAAVCGARGGKTYLLGAIRTLHLALTVPLESMAAGQKATGLIVAPDMRLAQECLDYVKGVLDEYPWGSWELRAMRTTERVVLERGQHRVAITCLPATKGGKALRGRSLTSAFLDECAFFQDASYKVNDVEVYRAVSPRVLPGGQVIMASTPWAELGLLYDMFSQNRPEPKTAIAIRASTLTLRGAEWVREIVAREIERDPVNAEREYGAEFMGAGTEQFFPPSAIEAAAVDGLERDRKLPGYAGGDLAFVRDSAALALCQHSYEAIEVTKLVELVPGKDPLRPSEVVRRFMSEIREHGADGMAADSHYRETVREHFEQDGERLRFKLLPEGLDGKAQQYLLARHLLVEGRLRIPNDQRLIAQLKSITKRATSGGRLTISAPHRANAGHGDLVSAIVAAVWHCYGRHKSSQWQRPELLPEPGTDEAIDREADKLKQMAIREAAERANRKLDRYR